MACKGGVTCQFASSDVMAVEALKNFVCTKCKEILDNANCIKNGAIQLNSITQTPTTGINAIATDPALQAALKDVPIIKDNSIANLA